MTDYFHIGDRVLIKSTQTQGVVTDSIYDYYQDRDTFFVFPDGAFESSAYLSAELELLEPCNQTEIPKE